MATQIISKPPAASRLSDDERRKLAEEWHQLDGERLALNRAAASRERRQKAIADSLERQCALDGVDMIRLAPWEFGDELVDGYFSAKDELVALLGVEEVERRQAAVPQKEKFFLRMYVADGATPPAAPPEDKKRRGPAAPPAKNNPRKPPARGTKGRRAA